MDDKRLQEIKVRAEAATPGPWKLSNEPEGSGFYGVIHGNAGVSFSGTRADNAFIAASSTDIPDLIAEVERLRAENTRLRAELEAAKQDINLMLSANQVCGMCWHTGADSHCEKDIYGRCDAEWRGGPSAENGGAK